MDWTKFCSGTRVVKGAVLLDDQILTAAASSVDLVVPSGYDVLLLYWHDVYGDRAGNQELELTFNDDSGNNYDRSIRYFGSASATSNGVAFIPVGVFGDTGDSEYHSNAVFTIFNRASQEKVVIGVECYYDSGGAADEDVTGRHMEAKWRNASVPITKITLSASANNIVANSRFILMGVNTKENG